MVLAVIFKLEFPFRRFAAVFHLDPIFSSTIAEGEGRSRATPQVWRARLTNDCAGRQAFGGNTVGVILGAILHETPLAAPSFNSGLPPELGAVLSRALEKDREKRYQTASELLADLARLKRNVDLRHPEASVGSGPMVAAAPPRFRRRHALVAAGVVAVIAVIAAAHVKVPHFPFKSPINCWLIGQIWSNLLKNGAHLSAFGVGDVTLHNAKATSPKACKSLIPSVLARSGRPVKHKSSEHSFGICLRFPFYGMGQNAVRPSGLDG